MKAAVGEQTPSSGMRRKLTWRTTQTVKAEMQGSNEVDMTVNENVRVEYKDGGGGWGRQPLSKTLMH